MQPDAVKPVTHRAGWDSFNSLQKVVVSLVLATILVLACVIFLGSWPDSHKILFRSLDDQDVTAVLNALYSNGFDVRLDQSTGAILVPAPDIQRARITLSNYGLPAKSSLLGQQERPGMNPIYQNPDKNVLVDKVQYAQKIENLIGQRIERLLVPLVGRGSVRAQVTIIGEVKQATNTNSQNDLKKTVSDDGMPGKMNIIVIVDDKKIINADSSVIRIPRTEQELNKFSDLIKKAVGFNKERGDSISLINTSFSDSLIQEVVPGDLTLRKSLPQKLYGDGGGIILLILFFAFVIYKLMKLQANNRVEKEYNTSLSNISASSPDSPSETARVNYEENMRILNNLVKNDPKLVAQIMKNWVSADEK